MCLRTQYEQSSIGQAWLGQSRVKYFQLCCSFIQCHYYFSLAEVYNLPQRAVHCLSVHELKYMDIYIYLPVHSTPRNQKLTYYVYIILVSYEDHHRQIMVYSLKDDIHIRSCHGCLAWHLDGINDSLGSFFGLDDVIQIKLTFYKDVFCTPSYILSYKSTLSWKDIYRFKLSYPTQRTTKIVNFQQFLLTLDNVNHILSPNIRFRLVTL